MGSRPWSGVASWSGRGSGCWGSLHGPCRVRPHGKVQTVGHRPEAVGTPGPHAAPGTTKGGVVAVHRIVLAIPPRVTGILFVRAASPGCAAASRRGIDA